MGRERIYNPSSGLCGVGWLEVERERWRGNGLRPSLHGTRDTVKDLGYMLHDKTRKPRPILSFPIDRPGPVSLRYTNI